jgi:energy-coupling factor transporter ATP-binding protein EcfA2
MPLDKRTKTLLKRIGVEIPRKNWLKTYLGILKATTPGYYRKLARQVYEFADSPTKLAKLEAELAHLLKRKPKGERPPLGSQLVGFRILPGTVEKFARVLRLGIPYTFYKSFDITTRARVRYRRELETDFYSINQKEYQLNINISAVVGMNGAGKSTLTELLYAVLNALGRKIIPETELIITEGLNLECYCYTDALYLIELQDGEPSVFKYSDSAERNAFVNPEPVEVDERFLSQFFYCIAVNYSQFALNSEEMGNWIHELFAKNDSYQVPLVIAPMRQKGNIDVNREREFVKARLLSNILERDPSFRTITESGRKVEKIVYSLGKSADNDKKDVLDPYPYVQKLESIRPYLNAFRVTSVNDSVTDIRAVEYIFKKLRKIRSTYRRYRRFDHGEIDSDQVVHEYIEELKSDYSHVTFKLRQAMNFLHYRHLKVTESGQMSISVEDLSLKIEGIRAGSDESEYLKIIHLIPPPFFDVELVLDNGIAFDSLSSGEKQRIHVISMLLYHLQNINSVHQPDALVQYSAALVVFDEIELYYHPELQRTFISYLLDYLGRVYFNNLDSISFIFITHSPFILSDVPEQNIMFLQVAKGKSDQADREEPTFGGNIHELLKDSFFLEKGYMGAFAAGKINEVSDYLQARIKKTVKALRTEKNVNEKKSEVRAVIDRIGEPLLRSTLYELFVAAFQKSESDGFLDEEILRLQNIKKSRQKN